MIEHDKLEKTQHAFDYGKDSGKNREDNVHVNLFS